MWNKVYWQEDTTRHNIILLSIKKKIFEIPKIFLGDCMTSCRCMILAGNIIAIKRREKCKRKTVNQAYEELTLSHEFMHIHIYFFIKCDNFKCYKYEQEIKWQKRKELIIMSQKKILNIEYL